MSTGAASRRAPSVAQVTALVDALHRWAPSADNAQPWRYRWVDGVLVVREAIAGLPTADPTRQLPTMSLGIVAAVLDLVAAAADPPIAVRARFDLDPAALGARFELTLAGDGPETDPLYEALPTRWCDRRPFASSTVDPAVHDACIADPAAPVGLHFTGDVMPIVRRDGLVWRRIFGDDAGSRAEMRRWLRFTDHEAAETRDGMPWGTFVPNRLSARATQLIMGPPSVGRALGLPFAAGLLLGARALWPRAAHGTFGAVTVPTGPDGPDRHHLVAAGRCLIRTWLRLALTGHAVQPLNAIPLGSTYAFAPEDARVRSLLTPAEIDAADRLLQDAFGLADGTRVVWMFRTGRPSGPKAARHTTLRRPLDTVFTVGPAEDHHHAGSAGSA